jgi:hypothetical protein
MHPADPATAEHRNPEHGKSSLLSVCNDRCKYVDLSIGIPYRGRRTSPEAIHQRLLRHQGALATLTRNTAFSVMKNRIRVNQLDVGWMASDHERELQAEATGDPDWEVKAVAALPFGRLVDPAEAARTVNFLVSEDAGLMTGAVINYDQTVLGAASGPMAVPDKQWCSGLHARIEPATEARRLTAL